MNAAIIAIGSEMLGPTRVDTNSLKVTQVLERYGVGVIRKSVVGDELAEISAEIDFSLGQASVLVITGGLGPTDDDLTREALALALGLELEVDQSIVDKIEARFAARGWKMPEVNKRQANVFRGQETLANERGTAPGFHLRVRDGRHVWVFPGVPHEVEWMLATYFEPWLRQERGAVARHRRVLKVSGLSESGIEERLKGYYQAHPGERLTILASPAAVEIHLLADGAEEEALAAISLREGEVREALGERVFGFDEETLEAVVGALLTARGATVATAESCTGGLLSSRITDVAGSSRYFMGGAVCYTADAKVDLAGVERELIRQHGEVSEPVAIALAQGIRKRFGTTYGIGITGIAGPGGGTPEKPVGTVHIAVAGPDASEHRKSLWQGTRPIVKWFSTQTALDLLRLFILRQSQPG
jgi:nicotinamide-nucleotide amidase